MFDIQRYQSLLEDVDRLKTADHCDLIAVTKTRCAEEIEPLLKLGHTHFGENRLQEALEKWPDLRVKYPMTKLHYIGHVQSRKLSDIVQNFDVLHTLDREKLAIKLQAILSETAKPEFQTLIQVNTGDEAQKSGIALNDASSFIEYCLNDLKLPVKGLMCLPPVDQDAAHHFSLLSRLAEEKGLKTLSMGMTGDYKIALSEGTTYLRIGTYLFGERQYAAKN